MARNLPPPTPKPANLSQPEMQAAIPKIQRRIADLRKFDPQEIRDRSDPKISILEKRLETLLDEIFPRGTIEHKRFFYEVTTLDRAGLNIYGTSLIDVISGLHQGKDSSIHHLEEIISQFTESIEDGGGNNDNKALLAYQNLDIHPEIERAAGQLYENSHYANAIEDAVKALNALVRLRSGEDSKDGTKLMEFVFSPRNPVLKFNPMADQNDHDEQKGFMMMFSGAVAGLRNPRAHRIIIDDPERAIEFIAFISLLAKMVDKATK